jgi:phage terminase large subunit-like protein
MTTAERQRFIGSLAAEEIEILLADWPLWARRKQLPPAGNWRVWLLLAGRGFGKTCTGSEWVRSLANNAGRVHGMAGQIGLVGDTFDDVRHVMVEGPAGILANSPKWARPDWQPSQRRLIWPNGVTVRCFSADDPEQLRGPEFEFVWADEIAKWRHQAAWDNLMLPLRIGDAPRALATATPRPLRWLADLAEADDTALVQGRTVENQPNLSPSYLAAMHARYGRGWLARQELDSVLSLAAPDALFQREMLAAIRRDAPPRRDFVRVVIAADDWQAAAEALASKWAGQLPRRAAEIARLLRG